MATTTTNLIVGSTGGTPEVGEVRIRRAEERDVPRLMQIVNWAYRGGGGCGEGPAAAEAKEEKTNRAWTTESHLVAGLRTTTDELQRLVASDPARAAFFVAEVEDHQDASSEKTKEKDLQWDVAGCVLVEKADDGGHLGMFAVDPARQALGLGRRLMAVGESHVWEVFGCDAVVLHVISVRPELLAYYMRRGYVDTNETEPFPSSIYRPLVPEDLFFRILKKYRSTAVAATADK
jgi:GNAT superfamily N-acetyltransferase